MKSRTNYFVHGILAAALSLALIPMATAADAVLEEIIVTAQKRAQLITDIGVSATAIAGDQLQELGVDRPVNLGAMIPGLSANNSTTDSTPVFSIRGIGLDDFNANNSSGVGVYADGIYTSSPAYLNGQLFDLERVEVLRGPQGTLYGKNTTGGAINFISKKPTDEADGYVEVGFGRYETVDFAGVISGPLSETTRGRLAATYTKAGEGWQKEVNTGEEFGKPDHFAIRGQLSFDIGDKGDALVRAYYGQDDGKLISPSGEGAADALGDPSFGALDSPLDNTQVLVGDFDIGRDEDGAGIALIINYGFDSFDFVSISAIDQYSRAIADNYDGQSIASTDTFFDEDLDQWSQEFTLSSNAGGAFHWTAGLNISHEEIDGFYTVDDSFLVTDSVFFGSLDPADIPVTGLDSLSSNFLQETDSYGVYVHTETEINDALTLIAGLRYSSDDKSFVGASINTSFGEVFPVANLDDSAEESSVSGTLGLDWRVNDDLLLFGNVATSFKSGVYFAGAPIDSDAWGYAGPEDILSYELGFKWTLLDGSMQLNGAGFFMDYEDRQSLTVYTADDISNLVLFPVPDITLINAPKSESQGFELEMIWQATEGLNIQAGVAYLDSVIKEGPGVAELRGISPDPSANDFATGDLNGNGVIDNGEVAFVDAVGVSLESGTILSYAPEWSYNATVAYEFDVGSNFAARLQSSYSWLDDQFAGLGDPGSQFGPVNFLNAQASLAPKDGNWTATIWGRNITDESNETLGFVNFSGARSVYRQQPATYGISFKYEFF